MISSHYQCLGVLYCCSLWMQLLWCHVRSKSSHSLRTECCLNILWKSQTISLKHYDCKIFSKYLKNILIQLQTAKKKLLILRKLMNYSNQHYIEGYTLNQKREVSNQGSRMMTIHTSGKMKWEKETKVVQWHSTRHKKHEIVQKTPQQNSEDNQAFCQFQENQNWHDKNECGHNLMSVTCQVSDHHLHRE
jgi:hypothetical protein